MLQQPPNETPQGLWQRANSWLGNAFAPQQSNEQHYYQPQYGETPNAEGQLRYHQLPTVQPWQEGAQGAITANALYRLLAPGNQMSYFNPIEQQARREFQQTTIPQIMERFAGGGTLSTSALPQALSQAGGDLESKLAALKGQYGTQLELAKLQQIPELFNLGLRPTFEGTNAPYGKGQDYPRTLTEQISNAIRGQLSPGHPSQEIPQGVSPDVTKTLKDVFAKVPQHLQPTAQAAFKYANSPLLSGRVTPGYMRRVGELASTNDPMILELLEHIEPARLARRSNLNSLYRYWKNKEQAKIKKLYDALVVKAKNAAGRK